MKGEVSLRGRGFESHSPHRNQNQKSMKDALWLIPAALTILWLVHARRHNRQFDDRPSIHVKPIPSPRQFDYHDVLERARGIQHTFGDRSLAKAVEYVLKHDRQ